MLSSIVVQTAYVMVDLPGAIIYNGFFFIIIEVNINLRIVDLLDTLCSLLTQPKLIAGFAIWAHHTMQTISQHGYSAEDFSPRVCY